jgi:hypothetical protein
VSDDLTRPRQAILPVSWPALTIDNDQSRDAAHIITGGSLPTHLAQDIKPD